MTLDTARTPAGQAADVLLVEDNPYDAELTLRALRKAHAGSLVSLVTDGQEALDFLWSEGIYSDRKQLRPPRVVFLDLKLPKVDGLEVLERVKADTRTSSIPVVILTSSREQSDLAVAYKLGANSYAVKPVDHAEFEHIVRDLGLYWLLLNEVPV